MSDFTMLSGAQGWTPGGVDSQKNRPDASEIPGLAPPNTQYAGRNRKNNGLADSGESFFGQPVTTCPEKPSLQPVRRRFSRGRAVDGCPRELTISNRSDRLAGPRVDSGVHHGVHPRYAAVPVHAFRRSLVHRGLYGSRLLLGRRCQRFIRARRTSRKGAGRAGTPSPGA